MMPFPELKYKVCRKCKEEKGIWEFIKERKGSDLTGNLCKKCCNEAKRRRNKL